MDQSQKPTTTSAGSIPDLVKIKPMQSDQTIDVQTSILEPIIKNETFVRFQLDNTLPDGGNIFGIGCALDTISNQGVDYSNSQFGMVINSDLADDNPQSVFVFVHAKQTLLMNAQGIQVLS